MLPARAPELGLDVGPDAAEGRLEGEVLRARPLREVGAAAPPPPGGRGAAPPRPPRHSETIRSAAEPAWATVTPRACATCRSWRSCSRIAWKAAVPAAYSSRTTPSRMRGGR